MRTDIDLRRRYGSILSYTGIVLAFCSLIMVSPLLALPWGMAEAGLARGFLLPAVLLGGLGVLLWRLLRRQRGPVLTVQDGGIIVLLAWLVVTVTSALIFMLVLDMGFTLSLFESVSGWTTTGLSVVDVEQAPRTILLWRSIMQLAGGAGMAIVLVTLAGGLLGPSLTIAEGRSDQLVPHVRRSARLVLTIYAGYALCGSVALRAAGMSWFDAINHAFAAVSTGGFSTRAASIGYWGSPLVKAVTLPLMVLGNLNFQVAYLLLRGRYRAVLRNSEVQTAAALTVLMVPLLWAFVTHSLYAGTARPIRVAVFEMVTALSTTGFSSTTYDKWPAIGIFLLVLLMLVGGGTGSTAGAIKQHRVYVLARAVVWELRRLFLPGRAIIDTSIWQGDDRAAVSDRGIVQVAVFVVAYLMIYAIGTTVLLAGGFGLQESLFEYASALGTVGLSVGVTSAKAPPAVLWAETAGMFLGRLEIFIVLVALRKLAADGVGLVRCARQ